MSNVSNDQCGCSNWAQFDVSSYTSNVGVAIASYSGHVANTVNLAIGAATSRSTFASNAVGGLTNVTLLNSLSNVAFRTNAWASVVSDSNSNASSNLRFNLPVQISAAASSIIPTRDSTFDLGSSNARFRSLYVSGSTIYLGCNALSADNTSITIMNQSTRTPANLVVQQLQVTSSLGAGCNVVVLRASSNIGGGIEIVSASTSNGTIKIDSNATSTTFDSNLPNQAAFASNASSWASNVIYMTSNSTFPQLATLSNLSYGTSNYVYPQLATLSNQSYGTSNNVFPQLVNLSNRSVFASNSSVASSNTSYGTSNSVFPQLTTLSNLSYATSNSAFSQLTTLSNQSYGTSNNVFPQLLSLSNQLSNISNVGYVASMNATFASNSAVFGCNAAVTLTTALATNVNTSNAIISTSFVAGVSNLLFAYPSGPMSANTSTVGGITYTASMSGTASIPWQGFDSNSATLWEPTDGGYTSGVWNSIRSYSTTISGTSYPGQWLQLTANAPFVANYVYIYPKPGSAGFDPKLCYFAGSSDGGSTWTMIATFNPLPAMTRSVFNRFALNNNTAYTSYRLVINQTQGQGNTSIADMYYTFEPTTQTVCATQSNVTLSNAVVQGIFSSPLTDGLISQGTFGCNTAVWTSNNIGSAMSTVFSSNTSVNASNVAYGTSNTTFSISNAIFPQVTTLSNVSYGTSQVIFPQVTTLSNVSYGTSQVIFPQVTTLSNVSYGTSQVIFPQVTTLSNVSYGTSQVIFPQVTTLSNVSYGASQVIFPQLTTFSNVSYGTSQVIFPQVTTLSNDSYGSSQVIFPQVTTLSNVSYGTSQVIFPQLTTLSNLSYGTSQVIFPRVTTMSNDVYSLGIFGSNTSAWASNNGGQFASNVAVAASNTSYGTSNSVFPQLTTLSNTSFWASNNAGGGPALSFASNTAGTLSNAVGTTLNASNVGCSNLTINGLATVTNTRTLPTATRNYPPSSMTSDTANLSDGTYSVYTSTSVSVANIAFDSNTATQWKAGNRWVTATGAYNGANGTSIQNYPRGTGNYAFDDNSGVPFVTGEYLYISLPFAVPISTVTMRCSTFQSPARMTFAGATDGGGQGSIDAGTYRYNNWQYLSTITNSNAIASGTYRSFNFNANNSTAYNAYLVLFETAFTPNSGGQVWVTDMFFSSTYSIITPVLRVTQPGIPGSNASGMLLENTGGGGGTSIGIDMNTFIVTNGCNMGRIACIDDGSFGAHVTISTKPGGSSTNGLFERLRVANNGNVGIGTTNPTSTLQVNGSLSKSSGTFDIEHPITSTKRLVHSFIEGPRCDIIYRGIKQLNEGIAKVDIDQECTHLPTSAMSAGTFVALCTNAQVFLQNTSSFSRVISSIDHNILTITSENSNAMDVISWMVVAERKDAFIKTWERTDDNGYLVTEYNA